MLSIYIETLIKVLKFDYNSQVDVDIVRSDMSEQMQDWITGQVLINVGKGVAFDDMSDNLVDKQNNMANNGWQ